MKFIGIDYGTKRIGIAISDENGTLAFPKEIVLNDANTLKRIGEIIEKEKINLLIHKQKEFLTSVEARRGGSNKIELSPSQAHSKVKQIKSGRIDASAAALILQRYLDKRNMAKRAE